MEDTVARGEPGLMGIPARSNSRESRFTMELPKEGLITGLKEEFGVSRAGSAKSSKSAATTRSTGSSRPRFTAINMTDDDLSGDDTDLEDGPIDPTKKRSGQKTSKEMYCAACKHNRMTPMHEFVKQLGSKKIELKYKSISSNDLAPMMVALLNDLEVKELHFPGNNIGERGMNFIMELMSENVDIRLLDISGNRLGQSGAVALGEIIQNNDNLRELKAAGNDLQEKDAYYIVNGMQTNVTLKTLDLSHNQFREDGGVLLGHMLEKNEGLLNLNLSWNHLRLRGAKEICKGLALNVNVVHLDVSWNGFGNDGAQAMADALKVNNTLEYLDLTNNRINAIGASHLCKGLAVNETLKVIKLNQNPISTIGALQLLCSVRDNESSGLIEVDMEDIPVTYDFQVLIQDLQDKRSDFKIRHGEFVTSPDVVGAQLLSNEAMKIDPFKLLMVYAQKEGLRLWDVFAQFDKDGSMSISKDEFKRAIQTANIPITDKNLDILILQLDKDGDGEVDFGELVEFQKEYLLKERKRKAREAELAEQEKQILKARQEKLGTGLESILQGGSVPQARPRAEKEVNKPVLNNERPRSAQLTIPAGELPQHTRPTPQDDEDSAKNTVE